MADIDRSPDKLIELKRVTRDLLQQQTNYADKECRIEENRLAIEKAKKEMATIQLHIDNLTAKKATLEEAIAAEKTAEVTPVADDE